MRTIYRFFAVAALSFQGYRGLSAAEPEGAPAMRPLTPEALTALIQDARRGSVDAELELALAYDNGSAGSKDEGKAVELYQKAANQNVGVAHLRLGMLYETGSGVPQSYPDARTHYEQALALGVVEANLRLGILFLEGWGVPRDPAHAETLIAIAANSGYRPAQLVLSDMYAVGIGVSRDSTNAVAWAEKAANAKDPEGQIRAGNLSLRRSLVSKDLLLAREWYQLSAEQDYSRGMVAMAATFLQPGRSATDEETAVRWLQLANESGNAAAAFYLGGITLFGTHTANDPTAEARAKALFEKSSKEGEMMATELLGLNSDGRTLRDAFKDLMIVSMEERYIQRYDVARAEASRDPSGTHIPIPIRVVQPVYPQPLRLINTTGEVNVEFVVDTTGRVRNAEVLKSPHPAFSANAIAAINKWIFLPGQKEGCLVKTRMIVPIAFGLSDVANQINKDTRPSNITAAPGTQK